MNILVKGIREYEDSGGVDALSDFWLGERNRLPDVRNLNIDLAAWLSSGHEDNEPALDLRDSVALMSALLSTSSFGTETVYWSPRFRVLFRREA